MAVYHSDTIYTESADIVLLKFVESIAFKADKDDMEGCVVDILKDDTIILIRTLSGAEYTASMKCALSHTKDTKSTHREMALAVYDKWMHIHHN
jgi:hypothetical protein